MFQSAPPHGGRRDGDHRRARPAVPPFSFNPRPRTGGDRAARCSAGRAPGFNPRPRTGGDSSSDRIRDQLLPWRISVSIRAPARGATIRGHRHSVAIVSIRAPARGATRPSSSRPPTRVSIRAPARGATPDGTDLRARHELGFNPRPRTGGDTPLGMCFNPRPRTATRSIRRGASVSIRAPARGATLVAVASTMKVVALVSIRAPARGATQHVRRIRQSAPPHGGRPGQPRPIGHRCMRFQSAPPHGGRLSIARYRLSSLENVSIRAPARGATRWRWIVGSHGQGFR